MKWNEIPHHTNVTVNMRKPTNGICIIHYLKISVAIHALMHGFKFMKLKWLVLNILKAWHGGEAKFDPDAVAVVGVVAFDAELQWL